MGKGNSNQGKGHLQRTDRRYRRSAQIPSWRTRALFKKGPPVWWQSTMRARP